MSSTPSPPQYHFAQNVVESTSLDPEPVPLTSQSVSVNADEKAESSEGETDPSVLKKRKFVYDELVATEKVYIEDLKTVMHVNKYTCHFVTVCYILVPFVTELLWCYGSKEQHEHANETEGQETCGLWKPSRDPQVSWEVIRNLECWVPHWALIPQNSIFSLELEKYEHHPEKVGECFVNFVSRFCCNSVSIP